MKGATCRVSLLIILRLVFRLPVRLLLRVLSRGLLVECSLIIIISLVFQMFLECCSRTASIALLSYDVFHKNVDYPLSYMYVYFVAFLNCNFITHSTEECPIQLLQEIIRRIDLY